MAVSSFTLGLPVPCWNRACELLNKKEGMVDFEFFQDDAYEEAADNLGLERANYDVEIYTRCYLNEKSITLKLCFAHRRKEDDYLEDVEADAQAVLKQYAVPDTIVVQLI